MKTDDPIKKAQEVMKLIPHRYPFLLLDRILSYDSDSLVAIKSVSINEPFFQGHFPDRPIMPGVLIVEAMAQAASCLVVLENDCLLYTSPSPRDGLLSRMPSSA